MNSLACVNVSEDSLLYVVAFSLECRSQIIHISISYLFRLRLLPLAAIITVATENKITNHTKHFMEYQEKILPNRMTEKCV